MDALIPKTAAHPHPRTGRKAALIGVACCIATALVACGGDESGGPAMDSDRSAGLAAAAPLVDPCSLLTRDEVTQVMGWTTVEAISDTVTTPGMGNCEFAAPGQERKLWLYLNSNSEREPAADKYRGSEGYYRETLGMEEIQFVDGLGTAAMWNAGGRQLAVSVPRYEVSIIDMSGGNIADLTLDQARELMRKALPRLP